MKWYSCGAQRTVSGARCIYTLMVGLIYVGLSMVGGRASLHAQLVKTTLQGMAPDYAGVYLQARVQDDYITRHYEVVGSDTVSSSGYFRLQLALTEPALVLIETGVYLCYLYLEPGDNLQIGLPPHREKSEAERLNPYFTPVELQLKNLQPDSLSLNARIAAFDMEFARIVGTVLPRLKERGSKKRVDSAWRALPRHTTQDSSSFYANYVHYRRGFFRYLTRMDGKGVQYISDHYFKGKPFLYNNPAYMDLFTLVYDRYFVHHGQTLQGRKIYQAISAQKSLTELRKVLRQNENLADSSALEEMVILKSLHDEFFDHNFSRQALAALLDSLYQTTPFPYHKHIATLIRERITKLLPGFIPRSFTLNDCQGTPHQLKQYRGKLLLLTFCSVASFTSIQDFSLLERLLKIYGEHLQVLAVCVDKEPTTIQRYVKENKHPWTFLYYGTDPDLLLDYDVRAYPTYFLLDEDGKLLYSPAPSPRENLDFILHYLFKDRGWTPRSIP